VCWVTGRAGSGKTTIVKRAVGNDVPVLDLSAFSVDRCLRLLVAPDSRGDWPVTQAELLAFARSFAGRVLVVDGFDGPEVDLRLRTLVGRAATGRLPLSIVVTSREPPLAELPPSAVTEVPVSRSAASASLPKGTRSGMSSVLETLASARWASSGWMLGLVWGPATDEPSLATPPDVAEALAKVGGAVVRVLADESGEWFQIPDVLRSLFLPAERAPEVHAAIAAALLRDEARATIDLVSTRDLEAAYDVAELTVEHLMAAGDVEGAARCYWNRLGNFARLRTWGRLHRGGRLCRILNEGLPPDRAAPGLDGSAWRTPVLNDWGQFALSLGDPTTSLRAVTTVYRLGAEEEPPWDRAVLACHVVDALVLSGELSSAGEWVRRAQDAATDGLRATEGLPAKQVMNAVDDAADRAVTVASLVEGRGGVARELTALVDRQRRQQRVLREANRLLPLIPLPGPTGEADPEDLLDGRPAALLAILEGRFADARRILTEPLDGLSAANRERRHGLVLRTLALRAGGDESPVALAALAERLDDADARCELAVLEAVALLDEGHQNEALATVDDHLLLAHERALALRWIDLQVARSEILLALGQGREARDAATLALDACGSYRVGARAAICALEAAGGGVPADLKASLVEPEVVAYDRSPAAKRLAEEDDSGPLTREELHAASVEALEAYRERGAPFVLYLRGFGTPIAHGPFEFGPRFLDRSLRDALAPGVGFVSIQDPRDLLAEVRRAPGLLLPDDDWQSVAEELIQFADLIVSELYFVRPGVRFELQAAYRGGRWDRTVLVLPPLASPFPLLDSEELVQMFPRCVWADAFHTSSPAEAPELADLIARVGAIARAPDDERRLLTDPAARDRAHPVELLPLASSYEQRVALSTAFDDADGEHVRYYGFWRLFRAASLRAVAYQRGDTTVENRLKLAEDYLEMAVVMLDHEREGERVILVGDLTFARQCVESAYTLGTDSDYLRARAERQLASIEQLQDAIAADPDRFELRLRYGPFVTRSATPD
jgi:hypothetical protein